MPRTLLNSDNVVFTGGGRDAAARIEEALAARLGVAARIIVLAAAELAAAVAENPLLEVAGDPSRLLVAVLADPADRKRLASLAGQDWTPEALALGARVAYPGVPRASSPAGCPRPSAGRSATP